MRRCRQPFAQPIAYVAAWLALQRAEAQVHAIQADASGREQAAGFGAGVQRQQRKGDTDEEGDRDDGHVQRAAPSPGGLEPVQHEARQRERAGKGCDRQRQQAVQPPVVLLPVGGPRVVPRLEKVQQYDHLNDQENSGAETGGPACAFTATFRCTFINTKLATFMTSLGAFF